MKGIYNKIIVSIICFTLIFSSFYIMASAEEFNIDARSAILMDASTGTILYEKNIHDKLPPASVTKVMTMLLTMEALDQKQIALEDKVLISQRSSSMGGSQLYLEPGEEKTIEELLKGISVASANDACVALAEHLSGTEEMFVKRMNERAKELGMNDTQFMNTNGLPQEGHYTSAYDIAIMSKELLKYPKIHEWLTIWMSTMKVGLPDKKITTLELTNTNKLIRSYPGANGIKTGFTSDAMYCLSASASRNGLNLIAVILGSPTSQVRFEEAKKLLNFGFATYSSVPIVKKNQVVQEVTVEKGREEKVNIIAKDQLSALVKKGDENKVQKEIILPKNIKAPLTAGQKLGEIVLMVEGKEIHRVDLVSEKAIESASAIDMFGKIIRKSLRSKK
ncbi:MAG: D-alanyl-D-alanine carboxypeptidase [Anaerosolibacter sp.]|uniref:D-alanyl-D-alanine carboxypeptidase family protein n=1 Tax=Anaerosolibacter sp. TaxID=1872527 RepID=UPI002603582A|nr:D-alanyl-D-alanine carboxypeptidase family protein [Anaerosolibacter sp.]MDF2546435.1 D-alanyl-D-alanine carboxypeptidase [Anaerosolibacter sp.]